MYLNFPTNLDQRVRKMVEELWDTTPEGQRFPNLPKGWRRVDENDFCHSKFFSYSPAYTMYRNDVQDKSPEAQARYGSPHGTWYHGFYYHYHDGTGVFINSVYRNGKYEVEFFRFGCDHRYEHTARLGNCYNRYTCKECGHVNDVDSSD